MPEKNGTERTAVDKLKRAFAYKLFFQQGVLPFNASQNDYYLAVSYTLRDRMQRPVHQFGGSAARKPKQDCLLSLGRISYGAASAQQFDQPRPA